MPQHQDGPATRRVTRGLKYFRVGAFAGCGGVERNRSPVLFRSNLPEVCAATIPGLVERDLTGIGLELSD